MNSKTKHNNRRREIGKMLLKVIEYVLTIALIGRILTDKITLKTTLGVAVTVIVVLVIAFFIIPSKQGVVIMDPLYIILGTIVLVAVISLTLPMFLERKKKHTH